MLGSGCRIAVLVLACALAGSVAAALAQEKVQVTEYELKGAYLYKFTQYIDWPKSAPDEAFVIGVLGKDPFGDILDQIARERKIKGKPVKYESPRGEPNRIYIPPGAARALRGAP